MPTTDRRALDAMMSPQTPLEAMGVARAYTPTWKEKAAGLLQDAIEKMGGERYFARKVGETVAGGPSSNLPLQMGLLDPTVVGAIFARQEASARGTPMGPGAPPGLLNTAATVFHGSPHRFDKFDSAKIGTGEGAQAYGHGLYLADQRGTAEFYKAAGKTGASPVKWTGAEIDKPIAFALTAPRVGNAPLKEALQRNLDLQLSAAENTAQAIKSNPKDYMDFGGDAIDEALRRPEVIRSAMRKMLAMDDADLLANNFDKWEKAGNLYKVDLPDNAIARMLDWDKPLSQQAPEVQRAIKIYKGGDWWIVNKDRVTGAKLVREIHGGNPDQFSSSLSDMGVPGIRYLDGGSRGAGAGTSNYVVFPGEEGLLRILERNGQPLK